MRVSSGAIRRLRPGREQAAPIDPPSPPAPREKTAAGIEQFVPHQVVDQLATFAGLGGEHRLVSVGFVMVGGIEAAIDELGSADTADALGALIDDVIASTTPYGVTATSQHDECHTNTMLRESASDDRQIGSAI